MHLDPHHLKQTTERGHCQAHSQTIDPSRSTRMGHHWDRSWQQTGALLMGAVQ